MEKQFTEHRGSGKRIYVPGQSIFAKNYHNGKEKWIYGRILHRSEKSYMI